MYIVVEIQTNADGTVGIPAPTAYADRQQAEAKYHTILAAAAISQVPKHGAIMFTDECIPQLWAAYEHGGDN